MAGRRYDQCDSMCTTDCGHCKGQGPPVANLLDIDGYAARLGVPRSWVRDKVTARAIQFTKVGRHVRFSDADHEANLAAWREPATTQRLATVRILRRRSA